MKTMTAKELLANVEINMASMRAEMIAEQAERERRNTEHYMSLRTARLAEIDAIEKYLNISPRTSEIRKANREGRILPVIPMTKENTSLGG